MFRLRLLGMCQNVDFILQNVNNELKIDNINIKKNGGGVKNLFNKLFGKKEIKQKEITQEEIEQKIPRKNAIKIKDTTTR